VIIYALGEIAAFLAFWIFASTVAAFVWARWRDGCKGNTRPVDRRTP
jgi:hypothetical protein